MKSLHAILAAPPAPDAGVADRAAGGVAPAESGGRPGPGAAAVVIDVLRATTTLSVAFANGASRVIPAASLGEARALRERHPRALLCGERDGRIVPGFDLGNSPFEYGRDRVAGRTLVFASTNGSQAMKLAAGARRTWLGAFVGAGALVGSLAGEREVWLVAAGRLGRPSLEDLGCAGWIARALAERGFVPASPEARLVIALAPADGAGVRALVEGAAHARTLRALGPEFARDVAYAATLDALGAAFPCGRG